MRVLVCGGRNYRDKDTLFSALDRLHEKTGIEFLIQGAADGADYLAVQWASKSGVGRSRLSGTNMGREQDQSATNR